MPVDFGKECTKYVYLNGSRTEVHLSDGSLLYNVEVSLPCARGIGIVKKHLKDAKTGAVKYTITQERNREDIYDAPMYFISAARPDETGSVFPSGHGHIGRIYQDGNEICVSFRRKDSLTELPTLRKEKEGSNEGTTSSENSEEEENDGRNSMSSGSSSNTNSAGPTEAAVGGAVSEDTTATTAITPEDATVSSRFMNFFSRLFLRDQRKRNRFVALYYDGHGHWTYRASSVAQLPPAPDSSPTSHAKDIVLAHKEVEDTVQKKGFLGLTPLALQPENENLREMVIAAWLAVLWEEERWAGLPLQLRVKGLEYTGGCAPTPKSRGHRRGSSTGSAAGMKRLSQDW